MNKIKGLLGKKNENEMEAEFESWEVGYELKF